LAALHAGGLLTAIFVPSPELEALRDLVRAREDARLDRKRARHRLGEVHAASRPPPPTTCRGVTRPAWLGRQAFELPGQQQAFDDYPFAVDQLDRRIGALESEIARLAADGPHSELIGRLRCLRGIDTLTAVGLVCETGDLHRFKTAEQFMSFVGPVPSERSSGEGRRQGSITKAGSAHARRLLVRGGVERPAPDRRLRARAPPPRSGPRRPGARMALPTAALSALDADGRARQAHPKIVVACARKLAGFVWAIATDQPLRASRAPRRP
jgi:transposase